MALFDLLYFVTIGRHSDFAKSTIFKFLSDKEPNLASAVFRLNALSLMWFVCSFFLSQAAR